VTNGLRSAEGSYCGLPKVQNLAFV